MRISKRPTTYPTMPSLLDRLDLVIEQNLANEAFSIADLQPLLLLSNSQIYRKIKRQTGCSPSIYIQHKRLHYARRLILQSDLSLSEISYQVGFNGLSYFSRCFSKKYGFPPSRLRQ